MSRHDPPWRRFAIRGMRLGEESWYTDDGEGGDEACEMMASAKGLVTWVDRDSAQHQADWMREHAKARKITLRVVRVWEHMGGKFTLKRDGSGAL